MLCSDKTGTLTARRDGARRVTSIRSAAADAARASPGRLNSAFETGIKSPLDAAILDASTAPTPTYTQGRRDAVRLRAAAPLGRGRGRRRATAADHQGRAGRRPRRCAPSYASTAATCEPLDADARARANARPSDALERATGSACSRSPIGRRGRSPRLHRADERDLILAGFVAFARSAARADAGARDRGARARRRPREDPHRRQRARRRATSCQQVGLDAGEIVLGDEIDGLDDPALAHRRRADHASSRASRRRRRTASSARSRRAATWSATSATASTMRPSLHAADVGISVAGAVDVARDAADIILLEHEPRRAARGHPRGPRSVRQHHEVPAHGDELELRQHVQHGRRVALPAVPADAADADPAQQLPLRPRAAHDPDRQRRPELRPEARSAGTSR